MEKKQVNNLMFKDFEKWCKKLGACIHITYVDIICLQHYLNFATKGTHVRRKYISIFNYFYRMFFDRLYINIYKLFDKRSDVISLRNFFLRCNKIEKWRQIETNVVFKKIKSKRNKKLAHDDLFLALNEKEELVFFKENQQNLSQIINFIDLIKIEFEQVLSDMGQPIYHYALGEEKKTEEFKDLLDLVFTNF